MIKLWILVEDNEAALNDLMVIVGEAYMDGIMDKKLFMSDGKFDYKKALKLIERVKKTDAVLMDY